MVAGWVLGVALAAFAAGMLYAADGFATHPLEGAPANGTIIEITSQAQLREVIARSAALHGGGIWGGHMDIAQAGFAVQEQMLMASPVPDVVLNVAPQQSSSQESYSAPTPASPTDFSATNVQVEGVDEPDYLKNDGEYLYVMSGGNVLTIIDVWPPEDAHTVLRTALDVDGHVNNMFLNGDILVMFYTSWEDAWAIPEFGFAPHRTYEQATHALIVDITDRAAPHIINDYTMEGGFADARMIGDHAYFVVERSIDYGSPRLPEMWDRDGVRQVPRAFYFGDDDSALTTYTTLVAIDVKADEATSQTFLMGNTATFYVSYDNFYLTYQARNSAWFAPAPGIDGWRSGPTDFVSYEHMKDRFVRTVLPLLPLDVRDVIADMLDNTAQDAWGDISVVLQLYYDTLTADELDSLFDSIRESQIEYDSRPIPVTNTVIHRISIDDLTIKYEAKGEVPGVLHNQFSMDEHDSMLRVATTVDYASISSLPRSNAVFVLDDSLNTVGALDGVAPGESIFSARFMGERLYLVTFRQVDPFFVIDLTGDDPSILGELKLPGFSDYLHPYGKNYVIGVGRDTELRGDWAMPLGVKIAVFDVRDVKNPLVLDDHIIGTSTGTGSEALYDHKAFFFDGVRGILSVPISSHDDLQDVPAPPQDSARPWAGFYVFRVDAGGLTLLTTVDHSDGSGSQSGFRTFYIDDALYTVSDRYVKINNIYTLAVINSLEIGRSGGFIPLLD